MTNVSSINQWEKKNINKRKFKANKITSHNLIELTINATINQLPKSTDRQTSYTSHILKKIQ